MKRRVFVDTNIVIDLLANRKPFYREAAELFTKADKGEVEIFISALTMANTYYILSRDTNPQKVAEVLRKFRLLATITDINEKIIDLALNSEFKDFEDAIQYFCARENDIDIILTRNIKDFKKAEITVMTPSSYLGSM